MIYCEEECQKAPVGEKPKEIPYHRHAIAHRHGADSDEVDVLLVGSLLHYEILYYFLEEGVFTGLLAVDDKHPSLACVLHGIRAWSGPPGRVELTEPAA